MTKPCGPSPFAIFCFKYRSFGEFEEYILKADTDLSQGDLRAMGIVRRSTSAESSPVEELEVAVVRGYERESIQKRKRNSANTLGDRDGESTGGSIKRVQGAS